MKSSNTIRKEFIDFFVGKQHTFVRSAPVVPQDDPTLLFTNAGMNQFKAIFLGENKLGLKRAANSQKCMRVSGKHNDLEEVGRDHYHHTFFEMLGNWSFGDYYKKDALTWAWELLTGVWGLDKSKLYATVYKNDDEAFEFWKTVTDIDHSHISRHGEKDNFWEMGETGPCGPCSEIHIDCGEGTCAGLANGHVCGPNASGCTRFMEIWNNVFIQYNREKDGSLKELPAKHVDTGMGFERIVRIIQGKQSNYDIDIFTTIIGEIEKLSGKKYSPDEAGTPFRVIADHIRSLTFSITDGAFPGNEGRGYVVRRLLRRAYRFGRELGFREPFLYKLVPVLIDVMGEAFPEIGQRRDYVMDVIRNEESRFGQTLEQGIERFLSIVDANKKAKSKTIAGADVFMLYDTFGFPSDLTRLMASEQDMLIDEAGYDLLMKQQRARGRDAAKKGDTLGLTPDGWTELRPATGTEFCGYSESSLSTSVARFKKRITDDGIEYLLILDKTPLYAESGGQVGDRGTVTTANGTILPIRDTFKWNDSVIHRAACDGVIDEKEFSTPVVVSISTKQRAAIMRNHSATHLLQAALRAVVGNHVQQSGSRVDPLGLRFDFTHFAAVTPPQLAAIELKVNQWILDNVSIVTAVKPIDQAKAEGATALFGEKYGDEVRVVTMGDLSKELCGGTHAKSTGQIGLLHIVSESSIASGVRRIEAVTGLETLSLLSSQETLLSTSASLLKIAPESLPARIESLLAVNKELEEKLKAAAAVQSEGLAKELLAEASANSATFPWVVKNLGTMDKDLFLGLSNKLSDCVNDTTTTVVLGALGAGGTVSFFACAGKKAIAAGVHAGQIVKAAATIAGGNGGGSPARAQAGAKFADKLDEALKEAKGLILQKVK